MTLHILNDVAKTLNRYKNKTKYVIIASLKSETMDELINKIPGLRLLISSLPWLGMLRTCHIVNIACYCYKNIEPP